ncbi:MAG: hypothetical protein DPW09_03260 [Anaerolineae bacterium]|nr:cadherin-like domain-containing protein [Anaerolineales bacterium]MCQ3972449.1 hypothetical protein [Anaerolineae bacterium]
MKKITSLRKLSQCLAPGQSLVETAIVAPILIFMMIGVFEVGWALRGYLVLTNVSRETTRFAVRPGYLNYTNRPPTTTTTVEQQQQWVYNNVGYKDVVGQMFNSMANQLNTTGTLSPALIISHLVIDTGYPCKDIQTNDDCDGDNIKVGNGSNKESAIADCDGFVTNNYGGFTYDDTILHPGIQGYENFYTYTYDPDPTDAITYTSRYNTGGVTYAALARQLAAENNRFNCELLRRSTTATPSPNYVLITESFYQQPQLFGFPLISNPFTDPVPMYAHTTMRMVTSRSGNDLDKIGPTCEAYPFIVKNTNLPAVGAKFDILNGANDSSDFGWLAWNPDKWNDSGYLENELQYPSMALNDFTDVHEPDDHNLSIGDYVASLQGLNSTVEPNGNPRLITALIGKKIRIPVWTPPFHTENVDPFSADHYLISGFIWVQIDSSADFDGWASSKNIYATYMGDASADCPAGDSPPTSGGNQPPTANPDTATTNVNTQVTISVLGNDSDPDGDTLTITGVSTPANGAVSINVNTIIYTPNTGYTGSDSFTYTISDGQGNTATATVTVTVAAVNTPTATPNHTATAQANATATAAAATATAQANATATAQANATATAAAATATANANATATSVAATATAQAPVLTTIATDDLESWTGGGTGWSGSWSTGGGATQQSDGGSNRMRLAGNSNSGSRGRAWRAVNMQGVTNATLAFTYRTAGLDSGENGVVEVSTDGSNWTPIWTGTSGSYQSATVNPGDGYMVSSFQVRFRVNANSTSEYFYVDNIQITGYR